MDITFKEELIALAKKHGLQVNFECEYCGARAEYFDLKNTVFESMVAHIVTISAVKSVLKK